MVGRRKRPRNTPQFRETWVGPTKTNEAEGGNHTKKAIFEWTQQRGSLAGKILTTGNVQG